MIDVPFTRRGFIQGSAIGIGLGSMSGWFRALAADTTKKPAKSVIMLWLNGGPATIDLWDLKPGHANGGPFKAVATSAPGVMICEHLPKLAKLATDLAIVRSMATKEGDHGRATHLLRTGYTPLGAIQFPALGAVLARELGSESSDLPNFVSVAPTRYAGSISGGFLGPKYDSFGVGASNGKDGQAEERIAIPDLKQSPGVTNASQSTRLDMLDVLEKRFAAGRIAPVAENLHAATFQAVRLMRPEAAAAFDLDAEKESTRAKYGRGSFAEGCLLARRLVERGVPFVEVTLDGWDTHANNFERVADLSTILDTAFAALLTDLNDRGLLDSTLVICQGEFGRTPKINDGNGRDHWPASWAVCLAGGGIKGGQVIGKTTADGMSVDGPPTSVPDLIATVAKVVGVDPMKSNLSNVGRPIRVADPKAKPIQELI